MLSALDVEYVGRGPRRSVSGRLRGVFAVEDHGSPIGFCASGLQGDEALCGGGFAGEIGALYILRSHQRRGAWRSLMGTMAQTPLARGCGAAGLWVLNGNAVTRAFYGALCGEVVGEHAK
ncbi:GNAT family N-acetyltransferase [Sphingomonas oryzagri]